jgi:ferrous iron transport protein A
MRMSLNNDTEATTHAHRLVPLGRIATGQRAILADVVGRSEQVQRLKELGFTNGVNLEMVRSGSPCIVRLHGHTLCIRGNELLNVLVECED